MIAWTMQKKALCCIVPLLESNIISSILIFRVILTDILQYRLRFGFSLLYKTVFHLNSLTAPLSYGGAVDDT
jgi:hypothetical protein